MIAKAESPHRGRFQAQGGRGKGIEESESWAQDHALTGLAGHMLVDILYNKLGASDQQVRQNGFDELRAFIEAVRATRVGHGPGKKSYPRKPNSHKERVDLEIHRGLAFVPEPVESES